MKTEISGNFQILLRRSGYKATDSRLAVLNLLRKSKRPLSAQDIIDSLKQTADQATIYRILKTFKEKGLIRQIDLRHNHAHYEIIGIEDHHHLICTNCGRIEDVHDCDAEDMYSAILRNSRFFSQIKQHSLEFYGICKRCLTAKTD